MGVAGQLAVPLRTHALRDAVQRRCRCRRGGSCSTAWGLVGGPLSMEVEGSEVGGAGFEE